jgi:hypothetical protein
MSFIDSSNYLNNFVVHLDASRMGKDAWRGAAQQLDPRNSTQDFADAGECRSAD